MFHFMNILISCEIIMNNNAPYMLLYIIWPLLDDNLKYIYISLNISGLKYIDLCARDRNHFKYISNHLDERVHYFLYLRSLLYRVDLTTIW